MTSKARDWFRGRLVVVADRAHPFRCPDCGRDTPPEDRSPPMRNPESGYPGRTVYLNCPNCDAWWFWALDPKEDRDAE